MTTVVSVSVAGDRRHQSGARLYDADWVNRLHAMAERNITGPVRHLCLTDLAGGDMDRRIKRVEIGKWWRGQNLRHGWWAKVKLFDPDLPIERGERLLFLDLDNLVVRSLDPLLEEAVGHHLIFAPHTAPNFRPPGTVNLYSSACMSWEHGCATDLYRKWSRAVAQRLRGDQDWFATRRPKEAIFDGRHFQRLSESVREGRPRQGASVIFCVKPKNHIAAAQSPWVASIWRGFDEAA